jgi:hypothetical protein
MKTAQPTHQKFDKKVIAGNTLLVAYIFKIFKPLPQTRSHF